MESGEMEARGSKAKAMRDDRMRDLIAIVDVLFTVNENNSHYLL
jgi:hypothetical protein